MKQAFFVLFIEIIVFSACSQHRVQSKTFTWEELKKTAVQNGFWDGYRNPDGPEKENRLVVTPDSAVVQDLQTGLLWQRGSSPMILQEKAQVYVDSLNKTNFGGFGDWRVPTIEELYTLLLKSRNTKDRLHMDPVFDNSKIVLTDVFPNQAMLLSCDQVVLTLLDKTPIGTNPLYIDFAAGVSCGGGGERAVRVVRN